MNNSSALSHLAVRTLKALAAARPVDVEALGEQLGCGSDDVRRTLLALHREGLVDGSCARLTLSGLALGVGLRAQRLRAFRFETSALAA